MTYAPKPLLDLRDLWIANGGEFLGIVGDAAHAATGGYHEGRDDLEAAGVLTTDYSVRLERDQRGLSNAAAAFDFGPLHGSLVALQAFSSWLVGRCLAGAPGSGDVREIIYSPDGVAVQRYSGVDGLIHTQPAPGMGQGDASHLTHTHVSYFRDSEQADKVGLVAPYFNTAGGDMPAITTYLPGYRVVINGKADIYEGTDTTVKTRTVPEGQTESWEVVGYVGRCVVWWSVPSNRWECVEDNGADLQSLTPPVSAPVDEAAIRADQRDKDRTEAGLHLLP